MDNSDSNLDSRIIDLTGDDQSIANFVDLSKDLEVVDLCSCSCDSSVCSSDSSIHFLFHSSLCLKACFKVNLTVAFLPAGHSCVPAGLGGDLVFHILG